MIVAAQGVAGVVFAAILFIRAIGGAGQRGNNVFGTAGWFTFAGTAVLAAGYALLTGRRWGRGLAVFAELLLLGVAYFLMTGSHQPQAGIPVGAVSLVVLGLLFSPPALRWLSDGS